MELKDSKHPKPQSDEDALTIELRNEFALLNKIFELREIARDNTKKKLNRKAAKAAMKEAKKSKKVTPAPKSTKASGEWVKNLCWRCNSKFVIHSHWVNPPSMCKACAKDLDETYLPSGPNRLPPTGWIHIVSGGAPGSGKRR